MKSKRTGIKVSVVVGAILVAIVIYAFWPRATRVDLGTSARNAMQVTIDEEARTRVRDAYVVSAPIAGRLLRVQVEPGDLVKAGETVVALMTALPPSALDVRSREQALAAEASAEAALRLSRADLKKLTADSNLASGQLERVRTLHANGGASDEDLDRAIRAATVAHASLDTGKAAISMRQAELLSARAQSISFTDSKSESVKALGSPDPIPLKAPISGRILQVVQKSETTLAGGAPIMEIGNISADLEIIAELLSTDAVRVSPNNSVTIEKWGGDHPLHGIVERIEPWGYTKYSALGVEEQRVKAIIKFSDPLDHRARLGHGFRVEVRIVIWEALDALTVPSSALFRQGNNWAVFAVVDGRARLNIVQIGHNNGTQAEVLSGLDAGQQVVLYPAQGLTDGSHVKKRKID